VSGLLIQHRTRYDFREPVLFGPHRLMLRPRESRDVTLLSFEIDIWPKASVAWAHDVFGNTVATAMFGEMSDRLVIESVAELQLESVAWPVFDIAATAISYPFRYSDDEWIDLGPLALPRYPDPTGRVLGWAQGFVSGYPTDTLSLLKDLSAGVLLWIGYQVREDEGTQSPVETLDRRSGSCRDIAVLFVEAARSLGFGARIISGYLHNPYGGLTGTSGSGSTHAWAEVYVPGAGWIAFDPTNGGVGGFNLVPVAVAREIAQAMPVTGSYAGASDAFDRMTVEVTVTANGRSVS
jgi:transglutaminase-like putative cysteine protease